LDLKLYNGARAQRASVSEASMDKYLETNRQNWNDRVSIHAASRMYDLEGFKAGKTPLHSIELEELGDVSGKKLLHLQCHFGMDTLAWARLGAQVTGVDLSDEAIALARSLSEELGIPARFICTDIYSLPGALEDEFDVVYTSYGVLCWLPDIRRWAEVISGFLRPGGKFYIVEDHPLANIFEWDEASGTLRIEYPYFPREEPMYFEPGPSYTDGEGVTSVGAYEWSHSLGEVVTSLVGAGLEVDYLHEFPICAWRRFPCMVQGEDGWWRLPQDVGEIPMTFSLMASKRG